MYFLIRNSDGDTSVTPMTKDQLLKSLNDEDFGSDVKFLSEVPSYEDTNYWGGKALLIKGEVVTPTPKEKVIEYTIK